MRVLLTGSNGFLAQKFIELSNNFDEIKKILGVSKSENRNKFLADENFLQIDITDFEVLKKSILHFKPTHILHTAALTSVEACEADPELAQKINVDITRLIAQLCNQQQIHLTFLSTDFVFDGTKGPYAEEDPVGATNAYGQTKIDAEKAILETNNTASILRTILVYGAIADKGRSNLVLWAKKQLESGATIRVVEDQWRMPTWVDDLARACYLSMLHKAKGIFHISSEEMMTVLEAVNILADTYQLDKNLIVSTTAEELGQAHNRPRKTGFLLTKSKNILNYKSTPFIVSLTKIKEQLNYYNTL